MAYLREMILSSVARLFIFIGLYGLFLIPLQLLGQGATYVCKDGVINFVSNAPLELIKAQNNSLRGVIDLENGTFAFKVAVRDFQGFNNPLQRIHFIESYMEESDFPLSTFTGRFIGDSSKKKVRIKGMLEIHGVQNEIILQAGIDRLNDSLLQIEAEFSIFLEEYDISIPRMVHQKIAEEIFINVSAVMKSSDLD